MQINMKKVIAIVCLGGVTLLAMPAVTAKDNNNLGSIVSSVSSESNVETSIDEKLLSVLPKKDKETDTKYVYDLMKVTNSNTSNYNLYKNVVERIYSLNGERGVNEYPNNESSIYYYDDNNSIDVNKDTINLTKYNNDLSWGLTIMQNGFSLWIPESIDGDKTICVDCTNDNGEFNVEVYDLVDLINEKRNSNKYTLTENEYNDLTKSLIDAYRNNAFYDSLSLTSKSKTK